MPVEDLVRRALASPQLQPGLPEFLRGQRWFGGKAQSIHAVSIIDVLPLESPEAPACLLLVRVSYNDAPDETYSLPLIRTTDKQAIPLLPDGKAASHVKFQEEHGRVGVLYDAMASKPFLSLLLESIRQDRRFPGEQGEVRMMHNSMLGSLAPASETLAPHLMLAEQSNSSVVYGDRLVLKLFRRLEQGINPDLEIGSFLTQKTAYRNVPLTGGAMEYRRDDGIRMTLGILQSFVPNHGDAWKFTLEKVRLYFEGIPAEQDHPPELPGRSLLALAEHGIPREWQRLVGSYLESAQLLGRRTAELHGALSTPVGDPAFDPEPYSPPDQRAFCQRALGLLRRNLQLLRRQESGLPADLRAEARTVLDSAPQLEQQFRGFEQRPLTALRTRIHGDYHLGQVLVSGDDFVIIDFEGEPARSLADRCRKQSPLQDIAGMLRSFHYAAYAPLLTGKPSAAPRPLNTFAPWAHAWQWCASAAFLQSYFAAAGSAPFLSRDRQEVALILRAHLLEKAVYELGYELNNRPSWIRIPLSGINQLRTEQESAQ